MRTAYLPRQTTVVLLAAGHGKRMLPLTENTPKPLLRIGTRSLIEHHLYRLRGQGFRDVVINTAYLGEQISDHLGNGERYGLSINYSDESASGPLETAGGLFKALPLIKSDPFLVVNSDIWTDCDFAALLSPLDKCGRLVMVENPGHNSSGDFALSSDGLVVKAGADDGETLTFAGIALYHKQMFEGLKEQKLALRPVFEELITKQELYGIRHTGTWSDVGTPERLNELNQGKEIS